MRHTLALATLLYATAGTAFAEDCAKLTVEDGFDLTEPMILELYDCLDARMAAGYAKEGHEVGSIYRDWTPTATRAAVQGAHGGRLLLTYANDIAADQYLTFADDNVDMPVGSVLAKESVTLSTDTRTAQPGPLFIMTKVGTETAPDADGWRYDAVQPNGQDMPIEQSFCHDCHVAWEAQDYLAYPIEEVRIGQ